MFSTVTSWWSKGEEKKDADAKDTSDPVMKESPDSGIAENVESPTEGTPPPAEASEGDSESGSADKQTPLSPTQEFEEVSAKAIHAAKDWGSYLYTFGMKATESAVKTAIHLKDTVEEKTIIGNFNKEQEKFVTENITRKKAEEAAVAPWVGYNEEEAMKKQILALSSDKRNFLRNPPSGVQYAFDFNVSSPVAMVMLQEDSKLKEMRFELVPKQITEEAFWRNYFYRVSLIKQSAQLNTLAQQTGETLSNKSSSHSSMESLNKEKTAEAAGRHEEPEELPTASPPDHEFASDAFQDSQFNEEDLKKEMEMLGMTDEENKEAEKADDDIPEWEKELQAELQDFEVVDDGTNLDDADLEQEILQQIEAEAHQQKT